MTEQLSDRVTLQINLNDLVVTTTCEESLPIDPVAKILVKVSGLHWHHSDHKTFMKGDLVDHAVLSILSQQEQFRGLINTASA